MSKWPRAITAGNPVWPKRSRLRSPSEQVQDFPQKLRGLSRVSRKEAGRAEVEISRHLERNIPERLGKSEGVLAELERFRRMPSDQRLWHRWTDIWPSRR